MSGGTQEERKPLKFTVHLIKSRIAGDDNQPWLREVRAGADREDEGTASDLSSPPAGPTVHLLTSQLTFSTGVLVPPISLSQLPALASFTLFSTWRAFPSPLNLSKPPLPLVSTGLSEVFFLNAESA